MIRITVNGAVGEVAESTLSFERLIEVAGHVYGHSFSPECSVTFRRAAGERSEGILSPGQKVEIQEGTIFNVYLTGSA